jgi:predicted phosphodiesterase
MLYFIPTPCKRKSGKFSKKAKNPMARVLVIGDTHCAGMLQKYPAFLSKVHKQYKCNRVVHIGDAVDNSAISFHDKHPGLSSPAEEYKKARKQLNELYVRFPKMDLLIGNHDCLTERQATAAGLLPEWVRDFGDLWGVPKWNVHPRFSHIEIDGVRYEHGDAGKGGQFGAVKTSQARFQSVVSGHLHSQAGVWWTCNGNARIFGMNVGCGVDWKLLQFEYGVKFTAKPVIGCGVVLDGRLPMFIPMDL